GVSLGAASVVAASVGETGTVCVRNGSSATVNGTSTCVLWPPSLVTSTDKTCAPGVSDRISSSTVAGSPGVTSIAFPSISARTLLIAVCPPALISTVRGANRVSPISSPPNVTVGGSAATVRSMLSVLVWPSSLVTVIFSVAGPGDRLTASSTAVFGVGDSMGVPLTSKVTLATGDWLLLTSTLTSTLSLMTMPGSTPLISKTMGSSGTLNWLTVLVVTPPAFDTV